MKASLLKRLLLGAACAAAAATAHASDRILLEGDGVYPESITATKAGDLIIGAAGTGAVYRVKAGTTTAEVWLKPESTGMSAIFGVFAHEASNTLYVCSISPRGKPVQPELSALRTFDLKTGKAKATYPMPGPDKATCNDLDIDRNGTAFIADTGQGQVLRLKKGAKALEIWIKDEALAGADGVALADDGTVYVNSVSQSRLFSIAQMKDGSAGPLVELKPSLKLSRPDGMRALGGTRFLMSENTRPEGRITEVTVKGDQAEMRVLGAFPGATSMVLVGDKVWVTDAKFAYRNNAMGVAPEPFYVDAIPYK